MRFAPCGMGFRMVWILALQAVLLALPAPAYAVGPSFSCSPLPVDAGGRLACTNDTLARADIRMVQTYYALREQVGVDGQKPLRSQILSFLVATREACGLPPVEPNRDQSGITIPPGAAACMASAYDRQREEWARQLRGAAIAEAARSPEANIALQKELQTLGYLPADALIDGIFGTATRAALRAWQIKSSLPPTGFFGPLEASGLSYASGGNLDDPFAAFRSKPLALAEFKGPPITFTSGTLQVSMDVETTSDPAICQKPRSGFMDLSDSTDPTHTPCRAIMLKITENGAPTFAAAAEILQGDTAIDSLDLKVAIRWLDKSTAQPQITVSEYSGGAHCCTTTVAFTQQAAGKWQSVMLGQLDGDGGFNYLSLSNDDYAVMVSWDDDFNYQFSSYGGSNPPTTIQRLVGTVAQNVTTDPRYRDFLLARLKAMEDQFAANGKGEPNGFLAGWVAQKALVGQFDQGWRTMLGSYAHYQDFPTTTCMIDKEAWPKNSSVPMCPPDQQRPVPYPEALALFLAEHGYVTPAQAAQVGYDPVKILADRAAARAIATAVYQQHSASTWYLITRDGSCIAARTPSSPAENIQLDRANGLEDTFHILQADASGKPVAVRVDSPRRGSMVAFIVFYRGAAACESARFQQQKQLDYLK